MAENTDTMTHAPDAARSEPIPGPPPAESNWKQFNHRNPRLRLALIIGGIGLLLVGVLVWRYLSSYESTDDAQVDGNLNPVSARISGHIEKILIEDNQYVEAGTPMVQIDPGDYQVALDRAKADYADALAMAGAARVNVPITSASTGSQMSTAQADVSGARAGIAAAHQQLNAARAQADAAAANNVKAQSDLARYKELVQKQEISQQQYDQAVAAAKANAAAVQAAQSSASAAEQQIKQAEAKLAQAQAGLRSAATAPQQVSATRSRAASAEAVVAAKKAAVDQAELNLRYTLLTAPVSGIMSHRTVEVGENVQPGQALMSVINLDNLWVTANFKETQLKDMKVGQPVTVSVDATGKDYKGHVQSLAGASGATFSLLPPENATGNYVKVVQRIPIKITFDSGELKAHDLRPGMSVEPKVWVR
jgi:membrane fusion protein (multidrug efflux system)